ncbi:tRNA pseudouridine(13) synthase TruD [Hahella sp. KA22]|uniref:tRNA pseudouridine(13) synthase TruD n=1 Tax=Hahella sp. KA22 TaxID=1628392 RepID=UPI000FDD51E6|nr:tRNA pseudouridine(13) synthase TruD [Hahella sp. KA22]AZZ93620.1 tRNA pseudouridine(13) synthase TruD [Hahella sp. KA22]QAY56994.1 tRNA pseudouridine(13) synthase TruD [Hahella sp. KA22]
MNFDLNFPGLWTDSAPGIWRQTPEDFGVDELWTPPDSGGEHVLLHIEKRGQNTEWVSRNLARFCGVRDFDIGLMGLKDRHAVTRQWFSVYLGKRPEPDWSQLQIEGVEVLSVTRTQKKLRRGDHSGNAFKIWVRQVDGVHEQIDEKLSYIQANGFPNYFGDQRFGHDGYNLQRAHAWFVEGQKPKKKAHLGMYLSAARSYLFNEILAERVRRGDWSTMIDGDEGAPAASSVVSESTVPTGPMLGGPEFLSGTAGEIEQLRTASLSEWLTAIHKDGARTARRPFVAKPVEMSWQWVGDDIELTFSLGSGCFASVLLDQVFRLN